MQNPIGILDSGVGGLTVWKEIIKTLPHDATVYVADSKNAPYGPKTPEEIFELAKRLVDYLVEKKVKIIVIACNTITVTCLSQLRETYPDIPIIGTVPVIKKAAEISKNKKIGILSTTRTAQSEYQNELIQKFAHECEVVSIGTDKLVPLIERGVVEGLEVKEVLEDILRLFKKQKVDTVALGCTHYPFVQKEIQKVLGKKVRLLEPSSAVARHTKTILEKNNLLASVSDVQPSYDFFTTGDMFVFNRTVKKLLAGVVRKTEFK